MRSFAAKTSDILAEQLVDLPAPRDISPNVKSIENFIVMRHRLAGTSWFAYNRSIQNQYCDVKFSKIPF